MRSAKTRVAVGAAVVTLLALLGACGDDACPAGSTSTGGRCVGATDAGPTDAGHDAGGDAGPCNGACSGDTPVCDTMTGMCVGCLGAIDCAAPMPACDTDTHTCVACVGDRDCTDVAMGKCDVASHTCLACGTSTDCSHFTDTAVCDTTNGTCVQCTADDTSACGGNVCDASTQTCSTQPPDSAGLCQECVSDAQCHMGQLCVPMTFGDPAMPVGNFCLWRQDATGSGAPNGDCTMATHPYVVPVADATSVDGTSATVCGLRLTTCPALHDFGMTTCSGAGDNASCGAAGLDDGISRSIWHGLQVLGAVWFG